MSTLLRLWNGLNLNQRLLLGVVGGAMVVAVVASLMWARQPDYTVLYGNVVSEDAAQIVDHLRSKGIPYKLEDGGRTVMVPSRHVYDTRLDLAVEGLPESGMVGYEIFDQTGFGVTDFVQRLNYRRSLEGEISRSIQSLNEVLSARVHIVIPEETLFLEDQAAATASVVLRLRGSLGDAQVSGIVRLVAASVEGLRPDNVTVIDTYGNLLSRPRNDDDVASLASTQLELKQQVEGHLRDKVVSMIAGVLGRGTVVAEVNVELDFERIDRTIETYDSETPAVRSEQRIKGTEGDEGGKTENITTNYELSKTLEHIASPVGGIRKLTVAVLVDGSYTDTEEGEQEYVPRTDEEMNRLRGIIQSAVGFDETRGDLLEVHNVPFDGDAVSNEQQAIANADRLTLFTDILNRVGQVLVILLLAILARAFYRRTAGALQQHMSQVESRRKEESAVVQLSPEDDRHHRMQQEIEQLVLARPAEINAVIRTWLKEE